MNEVPAASLCHDHHVFKSDSTHSLIVQTRLDSNDIAGAQIILATLAERWRFMDIESQAMAGSMKEPLHPSIDQAGRETLAIEVIHDFPMNVVRAGAIFNAAEGDLLAMQHAVVRMLQPL